GPTARRLDALAVLHARRRDAHRPAGRRRRRHLLRPGDRGAAVGDDPRRRPGPGADGGARRHGAGGRPLARRPVLGARQRGGGGGGRFGWPGGGRAGPALQTRERLTALAFSPDGARLAAAGYRATLLFDRAGRLLRRAPAPPQPYEAGAQTVAFSADGRLLA